MIRDTLQRLLSYYHALSEREQRTVRYGAILSAGVMLIFGIFLPLSQHLDNLEHAYQQSLSLHAFLQEAASQRPAAHTLAKNTNKPFSLSQLERSLTAAGLSSFAQPFHQNNGQTVELRFDAVPSTLLFAWLQQVQVDYATAPSRFHAEKVKEGEVNATVVFLLSGQ